MEFCVANILRDHLEMLSQYQWFLAACSKNFYISVQLVAIKELKRLQCQARVYWVSMNQHVERHCRKYINCQKFKLPQPTRAPLTSMPIGKPWQMVAVDILIVPISTNGNKYLLVIQDYFTKWATAIPVPNQSAATITSALINLFSQMGIPDAVHSDQG